MKEKRVSMRKALPPKISRAIRRSARGYRTRVKEHPTINLYEQKQSDCEEGEPLLAPQSKRQQKQPRRRHSHRPRNKHYASYRQRRARRTDEQHAELLAREPARQIRGIRTYHEGASTVPLGSTYFPRHAYGPPSGYAAVHESPENHAGRCGDLQGEVGNIAGRQKEKGAHHPVGEGDGCREASDASAWADQGPHLEADKKSDSPSKGCPIAAA